MDFDIEFYEDDRSRKPVEKFLGELKPVNPYLFHKLTEAINKLKNRFYHKEPLSKSLSQGLFELRVLSGSNIARIIYFFRKGRRIILLHGFIKKTQKTPANQLEIARKRMKDYMERNIKDEN